MDTTVRDKLDKHIIGAQALLYRTIENGLFEIMPTWLRGVSGVQIPSYNIFMPLTPDALNDDILADTSAYFYSRNVLYTIELIHDRLPQGPDYLTKRYYQPLPPQPAMYLPELPQDVPLNEGVRVEQVLTVPSHTAFYTMLHQVFDFSYEDVLTLFPVFHLKKEYTNTIRHYLAFVEDDPAGACTLVCKDGVASIWNLCTVDEYRQRGVAITLLHTMLAQAARDGYTLAMVYSTAQAFYIFNRFGFEIYTQRQWFLPPGLQYE